MKETITIDIEGITPEQAYNLAVCVKASGKRQIKVLNKLRKIVIAEPRFAYCFARDIDRKGRDDTRLACLTSTQYMWKYTSEIDKKPIDIIRDFFLYLDIEKHEVTNKDKGWYIYTYAKDIDKEPRDDTRNAVLSSARYSYEYAKDVDKGPRDDTRLGACQAPREAFQYAKLIDEALHPETLAAASEHADYFNNYINHFKYVKEQKEREEAKKKLEEKTVTKTVKSAYTPQKEYTIA